VYVALPGGSAGGQFSSEMNGTRIVVLDVDRNFEFVKRIPTWNVPASMSPEEVSGVAASRATNMMYVATRGRLAAFDLGSANIAQLLAAPGVDAAKLEQRKSRILF
jgi:DNA-binding beta-propeller fold protein YncE